jgi:hypothetical protein
MLNNTQILWALAIVAIGLSLTAGGIGIAAHYQANQVTQEDIDRSITLYLQDLNNRQFIKEQIQKMEIYVDPVNLGDVRAIASEYSTALENKIAPSITGLKTDVTNIRNDIAIHKAGHSGSSSGGSSSSDFNLMTCEDFNCTDEENRFNQGDVIYVHGNNPSNDRTLSYRVYDDDNDRIHSTNVSLQPNEPFIFAYQLDNNAPDGDYRIEVEIDNEEDEIEFIVS